MITKVNGKNEYYLKGFTFKSFIEYYFALWCEELKKLGYIARWGYEETKWDLSNGINLPYLKQLKTKVKTCEENIFDRASLTADFTIEWTIKAENIFYLNPRVPISCNVTDIPFRLSNHENLVSYIETKGNVESATSSSISWPYKAKWTYQKYGDIVTKCKPFSYKKNKNILFQKTFFPKEVIEIERYKRDCKWGKKGQSKLKYPIKTSEEFFKQLNK